MFPEWTLAEAYAQAVKEKAEFEARAAQAAASAAHPMASLRGPRPALVNTPSSPLSTAAVRGYSHGISRGGLPVSGRGYRHGISLPGGLPCSGSSHSLHPMASLQHAARYATHVGGSVLPGNLQSSSSRPGVFTHVGDSVLPGTLQSTSLRPGVSSSWTMLLPVTCHVMLLVHLGGLALLPVTCDVMEFLHFPLVHNHLHGGPLHCRRHRLECQRHPGARMHL